MGSVEPLSPEAQATLDALRRQSPWTMNGEPLILTTEQAKRLAIPFGLREGVDYVLSYSLPGTNRMRVVRAFPPMMDEIDATFKVRHRPILYAWGDRIYATNGAIVDDAKMAHETVHMVRQGDDVVGWWKRYIIDREFRLAEEAAAHVAEFLFMCESSPGRAARRRALAQNAAALSSELYGNLISGAKARELLIAAAKAVEAQQGTKR